MPTSGSFPAIEPAPPDPPLPRYCDLPFPAYRFVPGVSPHPRTNPEGHRFAPPAVTDWRAEDWRSILPWLYAVDLHNAAYWWESHEVLEALWHAAGRSGARASFVRGVLHVAVAHLNRHRGKVAGAERQARKGIRRLEQGCPGRGAYLGVDVPAFTGAVRSSFLDRPTGALVPIRLEA